MLTLNTINTILLILTILILLWIAYLTSKVEEEKGRVFEAKFKKQMECQNEKSKSM